MSLRAVLEPPSATVDAGTGVAVSLRIRNTGDIVEEYHVDVVGHPAMWCAVEPASIRLYPGTSATVLLTFTPPRSPDSAAGPHPYGVRVSPVENPEAVLVPEGNLTVTPLIDVRAELLPVTVRGWRRAKPQLVVDNYGNATVTAAVTAAAPGSRIDFDVRTPSIEVPPGRAHFSVLRLRPERLLWLGQKVTHPYTATLHLSGAEPVSASGTYLQSALLPRWMARLCAGLVALLAVCLGIWFSFSPSAASSATAQVAATNAAPIPAGPAAPSALPSGAPSTRLPALPPAAAPSTPAGTTSPAQAGAPSAPALPSPLGWWKLTNDSAADTEGVDPVTLSPSAEWCLNWTCIDLQQPQAFAKTTDSVLNTGPGESFTVTAEVYLHTYTSSTGIETMVSQDADGTSAFFLQFLGNADNDSWAFSRPGARAVADVTAQPNTWVYLAGVFDAADNQLRIYVNGTLAGTQVMTATPSAATGPLNLGRAESFGSETDQYNGQLENVQVYQSALNANQINAIPAYQGYEQ